VQKNWLDGVISDGEQFTYAYLYQCAQFMNEQAEKIEDGRFYNCMSSIIFCAFCIEAYLNRLGEKLFPFWKELEQLKHSNKLEIICQQINLFIDKSRSPFQSYNEIFKFRNLIAHAKLGEFPKFEKMCTIEHARKFITDTQDMIIAIHEKAGYGKFPFVIMGSSEWRKR